MKAVVIHRFGGTEVLEIAEVHAPALAANQVRVRVQAAGVNPVDVATRAGWLADQGLMLPKPQIGIGWDLAGVVEEIGSSVERFEVGDPVIGMRNLLNSPIGAQAEQIALGVEALAPAPRSVSAAEASTLPLNGLTASQALDLLALEEKQWLLVTGAAGGLGGLALELARIRGLRTIAVAGAGDESMMRQLGATEFVTRTEDLGAAVRRLLPAGVDGALDAALLGIAALDAVRDGGAFVAVAAGAAPVPLRGIRVQNVWIQNDAHRLTELAALMDSGRLTPRVASVEPLESVADAHQRLERGGLRGRIVLEPNRG